MKIEDGAQSNLNLIFQSFSTKELSKYNSKNNL